MYLKKVFFKGQSMFEVLLAIGIIALVTVAIVNVSVIAVRNNLSAKNKSLATKYTNQAMEWLRGHRDKKFQPLWAHAHPEGRTYCADELLDDLDGWPLSNSDLCETDQYIEGTNFLREVTLYRIPPDKLEVTIVTRWIDSSGTHEARSTTYFTRW